MTKGIILSGGWGTRLRPLTCTIPKALIPIINKPVIERQLMLLKAAGVTDIVLAVSIMSDTVKKYFKDGEDFGLKITYTNEKHPLGTAGAIKLAKDILKDDNFFMLNGDVVLNFDFGDMLKAHIKYKGIGTISAKNVYNPSRYGVLIIDENTQKIERFLEKDQYSPPKEKVIPMPINAGVYILEPEVFDYIESNSKVSIERDVFPKLAEEQKLYSYYISGIWKDIGTPYDLLKSNIIFLKDILDNLPEKRENLIDDSVDIEGRALFYPPVAIGKNVVIKKNCILGPNVVVGDNVYIGEGATIKDALIYEDTRISNNVTIENTIISDNCLIGNYVVTQGHDTALVIISSFVEVLEHIRIIAPLDSSLPLTICHHEIVKTSLP
jgi:mannose-1-phosphate guanylyltransferase/phosphomannomutase